MSSLLFFIKKLSTYRRELLIGILLSLTLAVSSIALLTLSGWFISAAAFAGLATVSAAAFNYFIPAALIRLLAFIRILSRYADRVINHDFTFRILSTLRVWFYKKLIPLAPARLLSHRSGDLLNRIVNDIDTLDHLYLNVLSPIFIALFLLISITLFIAHFSMILALSFFIILCFSLTLIPYITFNQSQKIGSGLQMATSLLRTHIIDFLQGFPDLLIFCKKENRLMHIDLAQKKLNSFQQKLAITKGFTLSAMQLLSGITVWLMLILGITAVRENTISGAELAMIVLLVIAAFEQLLSLPLAFLSLGKSQAAADRLLDITHSNPAVIFPKTECETKELDIVINHVSFLYPNRVMPAIKNINLTIPFKTHLGITGDSGSGKTTLINLLSRIWDPTEGDIKIDDINLKDFSEVQLRKTISLVTQQVHIFNETVKDNLTLMQKTISDMRCFDALKIVDLDEAIRSLPDGLNTLMGEFGKNFSGGQIRRIAIARALLHDAPILILDEPSTGLGDELMERIWENAKTIFKDKTVIVVTHDKKLLSKMHSVVKISSAHIPH